MKQRVYIITFPSVPTKEQEDTMIGYLQGAYKNMKKRFEAFRGDLKTIEKVTKNVATYHAMNVLDATKMDDFYALDRLSPTTYIFSVTELDFAMWKQKFKLLGKNIEFGARQLARMEHKEKAIMEGFKKDCLDEKGRYYLGMTAHVEERELEDGNYG